MINIKEAKTKKEIKKFVLFPFSLYKNNKYWVPPIIKDEINNFDANINPVFKHSQAWFLLAYKNNKIVAMLGVVPNGLIGSIWMVGTPDLKKISVSFLIALLGL